MRMKKGLSAALAALLAFSVLACPVASAAVAADAVLPVLEAENAVAGLEGVVLHAAGAGLAASGVNLHITKDAGGSSYSGTLYLPGNVNAADCVLQWDKSSDVVLKREAREYLWDSGAPVAPAGKSISYEVKCGGETSVLTIRTMQGAKDVSSLFILQNAEPLSAQLRERYQGARASGAMMQMGSRKGQMVLTYGDTVRVGKHTFQNYIFDLYQNTASGAPTPVLMEMIGGEKESGWFLAANMLDGEHMQNRMVCTFALMMTIGVPVRPVDLWVNGDYQGNYILIPSRERFTPKNGFTLDIGSTGGFSVNAAGKKLQMVCRSNTADSALPQSWMEETWAQVCDTSSDRCFERVDVESWAQVYLMNLFYQEMGIRPDSLPAFCEGTGASARLKGDLMWLGDLSRIKKDIDLSALLKMDLFAQKNLSSAEQRSYDVWFAQLCQHEAFRSRVRALYADYCSKYQLLYDAQAGLGVQFADSAWMHVSLL